MTLAAQMRRLGKHSAVYGLGGIVSRVIAVFLLPVYTRYLDPEDFGAVGVLIALSAVLVTILAPASRARSSASLRLDRTRAAPARPAHVVLVHDGERDGSGSPPASSSPGRSPTRSASTTRGSSAPPSSASGRR